MSELDTATFTDDLPLHLPAETLKRRMRALVHRYAHCRSNAVAQAVARYASALAMHPALRDQSEQVQALCRLSWHWRLLAADYHVGCPMQAAA